ncbi:hypothetical protein ACXR0O_06010 [Verrucomicrobiota bacterium sgz303538]
MTEDDHSLVPLSSGSLIPTGPLSEGVLSAMVEQTLSIVRRDTPTEKEVAILFGDWDDAFVDVFEEDIRTSCGRHPVKVLRCGDAPDLVAAAAAEHFDLAIVTLNNVFGIGPTVDERVKVMLRIIRDLKATYGMPIIALTGYYDSNDLPDRARAAGADVFRDREDTADLGNIVRMYLSKLRPEISWTNKG